MSLTRGMLKELGIEADVIDKIMVAHGESMSAMVSKGERDEQVKSAVDTARAEWEKGQKKVEESKEYKDLLGKYNGLQTDLKLNDYKVKAKYRDIVKSKIDLNDFDRSISSVKTEFAEFFEQEEGKKSPEEANKGQKPKFADDNNNKTNEPSAEEKVANIFKKCF